MDVMPKKIRNIYSDLHNDFFAAIENIKDYIQLKGDSKDIQYKLHKSRARWNFRAVGGKRISPVRPTTI